MDTKVIEKFSIEAREQLLKDMEQRLYAYGLDDAGRAEADPEADAVRGTVLTATEKTQRAELYRRIEQEGVAAFASQMAYTLHGTARLFAQPRAHAFRSGRNL